MHETFAYYYYPGAYTAKIDEGKETRDRWTKKEKREGERWRRRKRESWKDKEKERESP